ncbi:hypothetical protein [Kordia sp.]|uniref:hypothetical protein n=1 Tax=Kordia sp. TaxID=1965332 RepID=UPI003B5A34B6
MLNIKAKTRSFIIVCGVVLIIFYIEYSNRKEDEHFAANAEYTIGKVSKITKRGGHRTTSISRIIEYKYYYKGKWISDHGPLEKELGEVRNGAPIIDAYYAVKYDPSNLSSSKILITSRPITRNVAFKSYTKMYGEIESINPTYPGYIRINAAYTFKGERYKVETILHKDSLPCGTLDECKESKRIKLFVSDNFPYFTDLFYKSSNRQHLQ